MLGFGDVYAGGERKEGGERDAIREVTWRAVCV